MRTEIWRSSVTSRATVENPKILEGATRRTHNRPCPTWKTFGKSEDPLPQGRLRETRNPQHQSEGLHHLFRQPRLLTPTRPVPAYHIRDGSLLRKESGHPRMFNPPIPARMKIRQRRHETDDVKFLVCLQPGLPQEGYDCPEHLSPTVPRW